MQRLIEIRSYKLKPGSGARFHDLVTNQSMPLLRERNMEVVAFGPSLHDPDAYFLLRAYDNLEHLRSSQEAFYSSDAWRNGPRQSIVELIESDWNVVLWLTPQAVAAIRESVAPRHREAIVRPGEIDSNKGPEWDPFDYSRCVTPAQRALFLRGC